MYIVNVSYAQEEIELARRKFLRHISMISEAMDSEPFPRLLVLEFTGKQSDARGMGHLLINSK